MKFLQQPLNRFVSETIHGVPNSRKVLVTKKDNKNIDAITQASLSLKLGQCWDWHMHEDIDEIAIVMKGEGIFGLNNKELLYKKDDVITIPTNSMHKWRAITNSEFIFIRVKK